jgi:nucleotide-binding universal stress UspA family protein
LRFPPAHFFIRAKYQDDATEYRLTFLCFHWHASCSLILMNNGGVMAKSKTYLVPIDFSRGSRIAFRHAAKLAGKNQGKLILVHVVPPLSYPVGALLPKYFSSIERQAKYALEKMARRQGLHKNRFQTLVFESADAARVIADEAKKFRVAMVVMSSHGRTGLERAMLGSVAERTLRYAGCPVLVVKK